MTDLHPEERRLLQQQRELEEQDRADDPHASRECGEDSSLKEQGADLHRPTNKPEQDLTEGGPACHELHD